MTAILGPLRFNTWQQREAFRDYVQEKDGVDVTELEDWDVQARYDAYCAEFSEPGPVEYQREWGGEWS